MASSDAFTTLSVAELQDLLLQRGVDSSACVEKRDLMELCRQSSPGAAGAPATRGPEVEAEAEAPKPKPTPHHHDIEQNTKQWFHMRRGDYDVRVGGSEIGVIVGVSPYAKPYSLYEKIVAQADGTWENDDEQSEPCIHGHDCEPLIAGLYKHYMLENNKSADEQKLTMREGGYYQHADADLGELYGASPDRRILDPATGDTVRLLEIKAPFGRMYTHVKPENMAQIQFQMWCSGVERCDYLAVKLDNDMPEKTIPSKIRVFLARVYRSDEYIEWMMPRLYLFSRCIILRQCPPRDLYDSEATGLVMPPKVRVDEVYVENGAWKLQECA